MQKRSEFDFFRLCRRFAILFDSCTDLLLSIFGIFKGKQKLKVYVRCVIAFHISVQVLRYL